MGRSFLTFALCLGILGLFRGELLAARAKPAPATIVVRLPADATLTVDGQPTRSTSATRWLITPPLEPGKDSHYTLKAEVLRGDATSTATKKVTVRAGQETAVSLDVPGSAAADRPARSLPGGPEVTSPREPGRELSSPNALPMDQQDPMNGFGPPGFPEYEAR